MEIEALAVVALESAIDALVATAGQADDGLAKQTIAIGSSVRPAGVARFSAGSRACFLLIVGPAESVRAAAPAPVRTP